MRIVAGRFKGKSIKAPKTDRTRPTSDRLRETIFNIIAHGTTLELEGARVLDLFAGSGALGLEAISRGARHATFIEEASAARGVIRENVEELGLNGVCKIFRRDATKLGAPGTIEPFNLLFADPPYGKDLGVLALASAVSGGWLAEQALCVLEERAGLDIKEPVGLVEIDRRSSGDSQIVFYKRDA
ncbi:16S rRNA (guanine966-N2)-methyltransferase [Roseibium hamelinense]|uniref:16S rRNA (Guanine966-N2)-methyltransferase n=1 Tax=Roseibium hamelinense TaxID=150831 RepID=A0A562T2X4_9HYPH|nr:16S rRNA (guanine(966)-N(2))-methyltransferase RsmD [Roseibium hamelinense]MTI43394.1 16S rRNA (guanine(966)-N(2))-methyltransferase RsmD [Roseibium hamelinense]TWI87594.1 16S rRNA (guanine966-N2)-methyltransferase [Roseibium hamelinense]